MAARLNRILAVSLASVAPLLASAADEFPQKQIRWIVPFSPGGAIDIVARVMAARLSQHWGVHAVVDNRAGEGGRVGVQALIAAPPDGYTQLMALNTHYTLNQNVFKGLGYDPAQSLVPITIAASTSQLLISNLSFPPKTVKELVALAKARPHDISYGSSGAGGSLHLAMALFNSMAGIQMTHARYDGGEPAATGLIAGQIQIQFINTPAGAIYVKAGKVRALGISTAKRSPQVPEVPTIMEAGVSGFEFDVWYGLSAPSGTPRAVIDKTYQDVTRVLAEAQVRKQLVGYGVDPRSVTPDEMGKRIRAETAAWASVIKRTSIRFE